MEQFAKYWIAADLGQAVDFTALAVFERAELTGEWDPAPWAYKKEIRVSLRHLERIGYAVSRGGGAAAGTDGTEGVERALPTGGRRDRGGKTGGRRCATGEAELRA